MKTLLDFYKTHTGRVSDKLAFYLREYDRVFEPYREQTISLLEIGIQNGGSLEIWSQYFPNAQKFVGCDINPDCANLTYADPRIAVIVGDATTLETQAQVLKLSASFDLIIDDGSHTSSDIVKAFAQYFPALKKGGMFVAEDLHCSYWQDFEGGIFHPYSSITFFKHLADIVNHEHWGISKKRTDLLEKFSQKFSIKFSEEWLSQIHSIEFTNSLCVIKRKFDKNNNTLGNRMVSGVICDISKDSTLLKEAFITVPAQNSNPWSVFDLSDDEQSQKLYESMLNFQQTINNLYFKINNQSALLQTEKLNINDANNKNIASNSLATNTLKPNYEVNSQIESPECKYSTSLIIPYFNGKEFIDRCIDSALNQSEKYDEIIIVNDGSTKIESDYLDKFVSKNNIIVLHKENGGQGSARNLGARHATSDFISFLDQDDFCMPHHNSSLKQILVENLDCGYVYGDAVEADGMGNILRYGMIKEHALHPKSHIVHFIGQDCFILPSAMMITKNAFNSISGFDEQFTGYEDDDLVLRLWRKGYKGVFFDHPVYVWCIHQNSTSFSVRMSRSRFRYIKKLVEMFPTQPKMGRFWFRDQIYPRFINNILHDLKIAKESPANYNEYIKIYENFLSISSNNNIRMINLFKLRLFKFIILNIPIPVSSALISIYKILKNHAIFKWI